MYFEEKVENTEEYDPDQGGRIIGKYITKDMARWYFSMFWGREDVYAQRGSRGGYFPQCNNRWNDRICPKQRGEKITCEACEHTDWTKLTLVAEIKESMGETGAKQMIFQEYKKKFPRHSSFQAEMRSYFGV